MTDVLEVDFEHETIIFDKECEIGCAKMIEIWRNTLSIIDSNETNLYYISVRSKQSVQNLIKALEKAIELEWVK